MSFIHPKRLYCTNLCYNCYNYNNNVQSCILCNGRISYCNFCYEPLLEIYELPISRELLMKEYPSIFYSTTSHDDDWSDEELEELEYMSSLPNYAFLLLRIQHVYDIDYFE